MDRHVPQVPEPEVGNQGAGRGSDWQRQGQRGRLGTMPGPQASGSGVGGVEGGAEQWGGSSDWEALAMTGAQEEWSVVRVGTKPNFEKKFLIIRHQHKIVTMSTTSFVS